MSKKQHRFMKELVTKSLPDTKGTPTKAFAKEHLKINDPDLADLELRGLVEIEKREHGPAVWPTRVAVGLFTTEGK